MLDLYACVSPTEGTRRRRSEAGIHVERIAAASVLEDPHAIAHGLRILAEERIAAAERPLSQLR